MKTLFCILYKEGNAYDLPVLRWEREFLYFKGDVWGL